MDKPNHVAAFDFEETVWEWRYCPLCGSELIEVYPGDYVGHTTCYNEDCDGVGFDIIIKDGVIYRNTLSELKRARTTIPVTGIPATTVLAYARDSGETFIDDLKQDFGLSDNQIKYALRLAISIMDEVDNGRK